MASVMTDKWGVGNKKDEKAFAKTFVGSREVELFFGEFPHSRSDNNIYARWPDGRIDEFDGHRVLVSVELSMKNYLKESELSGDEIRKGGSCLIKFNGE